MIVLYNIAKSFKSLAILYKTVMIHYRKLLSRCICNLFSYHSSKAGVIIRFICQPCFEQVFSFAFYHNNFSMYHIVFSRLCNPNIKITFVEKLEQQKSSFWSNRINIECARDLCLRDNRKSSATIDHSFAHIHCFNIEN